MGFVVQSSAAVAVAAVTGATIMVTPTERPEPLATGSSWSTTVNLSASTRTLHPLGLELVPDMAALRAAIAPALVADDISDDMTADIDDPDGAAPAAAFDEEPAAVADQIDADFMAFRTAVRTDFHEFANQLGYLGKQLYIAFNFAESIVASAVFNGTDMLRGEGVLKNLGEIAYDVFLAGVYVVVDQLYLALPGLPPIVSLPNRPPVEPAPGWMRPLPPQPGRPLVLPVQQGPESSQVPAEEESTAAVDESAPEPEPENGSGAENVTTAAVPAVDDSDAVPAEDATSDALPDEGDDTNLTEDPDVQHDLEDQAEPYEAEESESGSQSRKDRRGLSGTWQRVTDRLSGKPRLAVDSSSEEQGAASSQSSESGDKDSTSRDSADD